MLGLPRAPDALPPQRAIKRYLQIQRLGFAAIGIDPTSLERPIYNILLAWIPMLCILTMLWPMCMYAFDYLTVDLYMMADALSPMWQATLSVVKFFLFMRNRKKIIQLVRTVWFWTLEANEEEQKIIADENRYDKIVSLFYYSSVYVTGSLKILAPLMVAGLHAYQGSGFWESLDLPLKAIYIIDPKQSVGVYIFWYIWNVLGIYYILNGTLAVDSLFSWFMRNISAQFLILNERFRQAAENAAARKAQCGNATDYHGEFVKSLIECVQYHRRVIDLANKFNEVYRDIVFIKFLISCVQLACLTFQIPNGGQIANLVFTISFLMSVSTQLMLYCHGGQKIQDMSTSVSDSIYQHFQWHDLTVKSQKLLMLPMERSMKPCSVTGIFFVVDLSLFLWVFRTAGSFMTMLMTMDQAGN